MKKFNILIIQLMNYEDIVNSLIDQSILYFYHYLVYLPTISLVTVLTCLTLFSGRVLTLPRSFGAVAGGEGH